MESGGTVSLWLPGKTGNNLENWISIQSVSNCLFTLLKHVACRYNALKLNAFL